MACLTCVEAPARLSEPEGTGLAFIATRPGSTRLYGLLPNFSGRLLEGNVCLNSLGFRGTSSRSRSLRVFFES